MKDFPSRFNQEPVVLKIVKCGTFSSLGSDLSSNKFWNHRKVQDFEIKKHNFYFCASKKFLVYGKFGTSLKLGQKSINLPNPMSAVQFATSELLISSQILREKI